MAKKIKLSRKQIKQPDEFLSWSEQAWEWAAQNVYYLLGGIAAFLVLFIAIQLVVSLAQKSGNKPAGMLGDALEIMRAPIIPADQAPPFGLPRYYNSQAERLNAAAKAFGELNAKYPSKPEGQLALLYLGETSEQMRDYPKAAEYYQKFLATKVATEKAYLKLGGTIGLGRCLYEQKKFDESISKFEEVIQANAEFKDAAMIAAARAWMAKGEQAKANELLAQAKKEFPGSDAAAAAGFLVSYWQQNPPKPGEAKPIHIPAPAETPTGLDLGTTPESTSAKGAEQGGTVPSGATTSEPSSALGGTAPESLPAPVPLPPTANTSVSPVPSATPEIPAAGNTTPTAP